MKSAKRKTAPGKPRTKRSRAKQPPAKFPDFYKELKKIYGDKTFDHLLAHYGAAVF